MLTIKSFSKTKNFIVGLLFAVITFTFISCGLPGDLDEPENNNSNNSTQDTVTVAAPVLTKVEKADQHLRVKVYGDFGSDTIKFYYSTSYNSANAQLLNFQYSDGSTFRTIELPDYGTYYIWARRQDNHYNLSDFSNSVQYTLSKPTADLTLKITQQQDFEDYSGKKNCSARITKNSTDNRNITYKLLYNTTNNLSTATTVYLSQAQDAIGGYKDDFTVSSFGSYYFWVKIELMGEENTSAPINASISSTYTDPIINQAVTFN